MSRRLRLLKTHHVSNRHGTLHRGSAPVKCIFCEDQLVNDDAGIRAHVAMHARKGQCDPTRLLEYRLKIAGKRFIQHEGKYD